MERTEKERLREKRHTHSFPFATQIEILQWLSFSLQDCNLSSQSASVSFFFFFFSRTPSLSVCHTLCRRRCASGREDVGNRKKTRSPLSLISTVAFVVPTEWENTIERNDKSGLKLAEREN